MLKRFHFQFLFTLSLCVIFPGLHAADWNQWRGPDLNGISPETGWVSQWTDKGPEIIWQTNVGIGFSSISIADGRAYTLGNREDTETLYCFDAETGKVLWKHAYPCKLDPKYYEGGPSATPTVDGGRVYSLSREGQMFCLVAETGKVLWSKDLVDELKLREPTWGFSGSPLVTTNRLFLNIGTAGTALDKRTGVILWTSGARAAGYATPQLFDHNGTEMLAIFGAKGLHAVNPDTGKQLWEYRWSTSYDVNAADPIFKGSEVFISSGYGTGGGLLDFSSGKPKLVWESKEMHNMFNSSILIGNHLYGISGQDSKPSDLRCVEWSTGTVKWKEPSLLFGSLIAANDKLIALSEKGELVIAEAIPSEFNALGRSQILDGLCWTAPALSNGLLYARNAEGDLVCVDLRPRQTASLHTN